MSLTVALQSVHTVRADDSNLYVRRAGKIVPVTDDTKQWREAVEAYDDWDSNQVLKVIDCESWGDPNATNPYTKAKGLLQLLGWDWLARKLLGASADLYNAWVNIYTAHYLFLDSGSTMRFHWASSIGCWNT